MRFRRQLGFFLISFATGMLMMMFISNIFLGVIIMSILLVLGYRLYCQK